MEAAAAAGVDKHSIFHPQGIDGRPVAKAEEPAAPQGPDRSSPSLITLVIRSKKEFFEGNRTPMAQAAGFTWTGLRVKHLGILSHDLEEPIATMEVDTSAEAFGQLKQVEILFDPETGPAEFTSGRRVVRAAVAFAEIADGVIYDATGNALDSAALEALEIHAEEITRRRIREAAPKPIDVGDGLLHLPGLLSYQYETLKRRPSGRATDHVGYNYFDAPALPLYTGEAEGLRMALELVRFLKAHKVVKPNILRTIGDAIGAEIPWGDSHAVSRENVAAGFMRAIEAMVIVGARHANEQWFDQQISRAEGCARSQALLQEQAKREFVERMRAAKAAKKAAREGAAS